MKDGKIIFNNLQSLNDIERKAIDIYENGTRKEFRDFFEENFEDEYDKDKKQDKQVSKQQNISYNNQYIDNQYAMQMAQDISSYRYGKHMTGFVNY